MKTPRKTHHIQSKKNLNKTLKTLKTLKTKTNKNKCVYDSKDFSSGDGMLTTVWGPSLWHYLHIMSFNYPVEPCEKDKKYYKEFLLNLKNVLPCKYCRINLKHNFKTLPLTANDLKTRENFAKYIYNLHELVNKMLNKKSHLTFDQVRERYEHFRARCVNPLSEMKLTKTTKTIKNNREKGCTEPMFAEKCKCVIKIVPQEEKIDSFQMDKKCIKRK